MGNQNVKLTAHGVKVQINEGGCVYVTINGMTVYFENAYWTNIKATTPILNVWHESSPEDSSIDLTEFLTQTV